MGRARLLCHQWTTLVSVGAPAAHRRAPTVQAAHSSLDVPVSYMSGCAAAVRRWMTSTTDALRASWRGGAAGPRPAALPSVEYLSKCGCSSHASTCTTRPSCSRLSMPVSYMSGCAAAVRRWVSSTTGALRASWPGGAGGPCPTALPSVDYLSKRGCSSCASTCTHRPSCSQLSRCARLVHEWMCRRGAKVDDQHDRCAACQLAWRRCRAAPGCSAIGGVP